MTKRDFGRRLIMSCLVAVVAGGILAAEPDLRLVTAIQQRNTALAQQLIRGGVDVDAVRADGATALLWAAHWDDSETADLLLAAGADVNAADDQGVTPLSRACENASLRMVTTLLAAGADANAAQINGVTPIITAAGTGNLEVVRALLDAGAAVEAQIEVTGQTALMWATAESHHDVMEALIAAGAAVEASSNLGFTPLLFATRNNDVVASRMLIAAGVDVNHAGSDGTHAVALAIVSGHGDFARFLLDEGADPNGTLHDVSALHTAVGNVDAWMRDWLRVRFVGAGLAGRSTAGLPQSERPGVVKALLDAGADPNARIEVTSTLEAWVSGRHGARDAQSIGTGNIRGATPLWVAAYVANRPGRGYRAPPQGGDAAAEVVRLLLDAGADPSLATADGTTPLMVAAGIGHSTFRKGLQQSPPSPSAEAAVRMLIEAGADANHTNEAGFTALHGASFRGLNEVIEYLVAQGANINAQDYRERTAYSIAQGTQQSFYLQEWPGTAELLVRLGADKTLGLGGRDVERELGRRLADAPPEP